MHTLRFAVFSIPLLIAAGIGTSVAAPTAQKVTTPPAKAAMAPKHDVNIAEFLPTAQFTIRGKSYLIDRIQDEENEIKGGFAKTSRKCPPFCIHPMEAAPGVTTVGELELMEFLKNKVEKGTGLLIDARAESWYIKGTIPGSINIPFTVFAEENDPKLQEALKTLGVRPGVTSNWTDTMHKTTDEFGQRVRQFHSDFSNAKEILLFCNGPWCDQSPRAIRGLVKLGYPVNKMFYYRGGMQDWLLLGLSVEVPPSPAPVPVPGAKPSSAAATPTRGK